MTRLASGPIGAEASAVMATTAEFFLAAIVIGFAEIPFTPGGSGRASVTGPVKPLRLLTSILTEIWPPFFSDPPPGALALSSIGAGLTVSRMGVEVGKSTSCWGAEALVA